MLCEARGQFDKALEIYDNILRRDAVNLGAMKRKAAIKKGQHDLAGEITELNNIINLYPSDIDTWLTLAEIYLSQCEYDVSVIDYYCKKLFDFLLVIIFLFLLYHFL